MKIILLSLLLLSNCNSAITSTFKTNNKYLIKVWDYNYSMSFTTFYQINNDSVIIKKISSIANEKDSLLIGRRSKENEQKLFFDFLTKLNIANLKDKYENPLVNDGDQQKVFIKFNDNIKTVEIANTYQKEIDSLFSLINSIIPKNLKISQKNRPL